MKETYTNIIYSGYRKSFDCFNNNELVKTIQAENVQWVYNENGKITVEYKNNCK